MTADLDKLSDRELDALFAEKVLGLEVGWYTYEPHTLGRYFPGKWAGKVEPGLIELAEAFERGGGVRAQNRGMPNDELLKSYTRSLDAAWEGVEKLVKDKSCYFELSLWCNSKGELDAFFYLNFPTPSTDAVGASKQKSPARAVVLACLKVVS